MHKKQKQLRIQISCVFGSTTRANAFKKKYTYTSTEQKRTVQVPHQTPYNRETAGPLVYFKMDASARGASVLKYKQSHISHAKNNAPRTQIWLVNTIAPRKIDQNSHYTVPNRNRNIHKNHTATTRYTESTSTYDTHSTQSIDSATILTNKKYAYLHTSGSSMTGTTVPTSMLIELARHNLLLLPFIPHPLLLLLLLPCAPFGARAHALKPRPRFCDCVRMPACMHECDMLPVCCLRCASAMNRRRTSCDYLLNCGTACQRQRERDCCIITSAGLLISSSSFDEPTHTHKKQKCNQMQCSKYCTPRRFTPQPKRLAVRMPSAHNTFFKNARAGAQKDSKCKPQIVSPQSAHDGGVLQRLQLCLHSSNSIDVHRPVRPAAQRCFTQIQKYDLNAHHRNRLKEKESMRPSLLH